INYFYFLPLTLASCFINLFLGIQVYTQRSRNAANRAFVLMCIMLVCWSFMDFVLWLPVISPEKKYMLYTIQHIFWVPIGAIFLNVVNKLLDIRKDFFVTFFLVLSAVTIVLVSFFDISIIDHIQNRSGVYFATGPFYHFIVALVPGVPGALGLIRIIIALNKVREAYQRIPLYLMLFGGSLSYSLMLVVVMLPWFLGQKKQMLVGESTLSLFSIFIYLAITRYHFLNISAEEAVNKIFQEVNEAIIITNIKGMPIQSNETAKELFPFLTEKDPPVNFIEYLEEINTGSKFNPDNKQAELSISINGNHKTMLFSKSDIRDKKINKGTVIILKDITGIVETENKLIKANEQLRQEINQKKEIQKQVIHASKLASIGTLAAGVAHEINNPLTIINGCLEIVNEFYSGCKKKDTLMEKSIGLLFNSVKRIATIVEGLRTYARIDTEHKTRINIHKIIHDSIELLQGIVKHHDINIKLHLDAANYFIMGNIGKTQQVVMNIVQNSIDALEGRENKNIILRTENIENNILIYFSDNGCGIPPENIDKIFDSFFTTKAPNKGTGLGLGICYSIVNDLKGNITAASEPGKGTTITVIIPYS
ncbi:MAG: hypothetical protein JXA66_03105, partial [Oligoflexia bacterium]|nr:hypothetical protein [Oligoflexia bacterium]